MPTESFFSQSSLAYIASAGAGKDGKAYSIRPTDGTGDFTFSRGSNLAATRVGADGLIEKGRENLLLQSNNFNTTWVKTSATVTSDVIAGPLGELADSVFANAGSGQHRVLQTPVSTGMGTFSMYIKQKELSRIVIHLLGVNKAMGFDCSNNTTFTAVGVAADAEYYAITDAGNGWSKIEVFEGGTTTRVDIYIANPVAGGNNAVWTGDGTSEIYISSAQFELGTISTPYIETTTTKGTAGLLESEPRFDYSNGASCPSLLLEPSRRNFIEQSEYFGSYINYGSADTANSTISVEGVNNATLIAGNGTQNQVYTASPDISVTSAGLYTLSIFAKKGTNNYFRLYLDGFAGSSNNGAYFDLLNGSTPTSGASIKDYGNGWYKCSITATIVSGDLVGKLAFNVTPNTNSVFFSSASEANGKNIYIYGATLEAGSYPTSYIPTYGTSQTRAADSCNGAGNANTFNSTEGVLYAEFSGLVNAEDYRIISLNAGDSANSIFIGIRNDTGNVYMYMPLDGTSYISSVNATNTNVKVALKYKTNDVSFYINGVKVFSDSSVTLPVGLSKLDFNYGNVSNSYPFYGNVKQLLVFNTALSDADLATLTTI